MAEVVVVIRFCFFTVDNYEETVVFEKLEFTSFF